MEGTPLLSSFNPDKPNTTKKIFSILISILILVIVSGSSYYLGTLSIKEEKQSSPPPSIVSLLTPTPASNPVPLSPSATPTINPSVKSSSISASPTPFFKSVILRSESALDGYRTSNNEGNSATEIKIGRNLASVSRGFISFDITEFHSSDKITEAKLRVYQATVIGNPYPTGGNLKIDHITYGDSLDNSDYGMAALISNFSTLSINANMGWREVDVTEQVKDDISNTRIRSQYRLHFTNEKSGGSNEGDYAIFESAENAFTTNYTPQLVIRYN